MLVKSLYCRFFALLDFLLFFYLTDRKFIKRKVVFILTSIAITVIVTHIAFTFSFFMEKDKFYELLIFSSMLVVLHFMHKLLLHFFLKSLGKVNQPLVKPWKQYMMPVMNFNSFILIYILVYVYQCIAVFTEI